MKSRSGVVILCVRMFVFVALLVLAEIANAQALLPGIPAAPIPTGTGIRVSADWADPEDVDGTNWGVWGGLGFARFGGGCPLPIRGSRSLTLNQWPGGMGLDNFQPGGTSHSEERWIARRRASSGESFFPDR
jgi:hypothetical protein